MKTNLSAKVLLIATLILSCTLFSSCKKKLSPIEQRIEDARQFAFFISTKRLVIESYVDKKGNDLMKQEFLKCAVYDTIGFPLILPVHSSEAKPFEQWDRVKVDYNKQNGCNANKPKFDIGINRVCFMYDYSGYAYYQFIGLESIWNFANSLQLLSWDKQTGIIKMTEHSRQAYDNIITIRAF